MGTSNFCYQNRCVVLTNDDYEFDNVPKLGNWVNDSRSYASKEILYKEISCTNEYAKTIKPIRLHQIVMTNGYYEHACIDFILNENEYVTDCLGSLDYYNFCDMEEIQNEIVETYHITHEEFQLIYKKVMNNMGISETDEDDFDTFFDVLMNEIYDKIVENEIVHCNKIIDLIKENYGYEEYGCVAVASNGESFYNKID